MKEEMVLIKKLKGKYHNLSMNIDNKNIDFNILRKKTTKQNTSSQFSNDMNSKFNQKVPVNPISELRVPLA